MIKCALISGKHMGMMHASNFHNHAEAEVVAVCDMDSDLRAKAEAEFQVAGYESIEELLANCDVDLILLIVNETRRIPPLHQLLAAGQNVFTEKPLCGLEGQHRLREVDAQGSTISCRRGSCLERVSVRSSGTSFGQQQR